jgi:4-hydroxythreonine-4-phosphate dehydrogenase
MGEAMGDSGADLAVTMGDAAGIGPEITLKALAALEPAARPLVIGDATWLAGLGKALALDLDIRAVEDPAEAARGTNAVRVLDAVRVPATVRLGEVSAAAGAAAHHAIRTAVELALEGRIAGIVTAPIHKAALHAAGVPFPGHTEMLAHYAGVRDVAMMLATPDLRVVLVTIHVALKEAIARLDIEAERRAIRFAETGARAFTVARPRIAVAGLNPHAGEDGLFGREEIDIIAPAIAAERAAGRDVSGPWPGDTVFAQARAGRFDVVVAQYHDQGLIPIKYLGLDEGVNVTLGLPFIRTSPDHGTAFDIAARLVADPASMGAALALAARMSREKPSTLV